MKSGALPMTTAVFIPGLLSDERVWRAVADKVPGPVVMADVTRDNTITGMAVRILEEVSGDLVVVGHSMGGRVAMEMAHQAPNRVSRLVLANTGHDALKPGELEKRKAKIEEGHADLPAMVKTWLPPMVAASRHSDAALMADLTEMAIALGPVVHERQITALINRPDAGTYLPEIACPILLMTGSEDAWSPEKQHREMMSMAPNAEFHVVNHGGHFIPVEQPLVVAKLISDWLSDKY